jgi:hypothetical protein
MGRFDYIIISKTALHRLTYLHLSTDPATSIPKADKACTPITDSDGLVLL